MEKEHTKLIVDCDRRTWITRPARHNDEWDRDDTDTEWTVNGLQISDTDDRFDVVIDGTVSPGKQIWLVWAVYGTGDSFGSDDRARIEFVSAHRNEYIARHNAKTLSDIDADANCGDKVDLQLDNGDTLPFLPPWLGYFENLNYVEVRAFTVGDGKGTNNQYYPARR